MPLEFNTKSHGIIPIGFFNIDTDMFLISDHFVFVSDLCQWIIEWSKGEDDQRSKESLYLIDSTEKIGNLMGAIHNVEHTGFIGEVYKLFPFPKEERDFKQKPQGFKNRDVVERMIQKYASNKQIDIIISKENGTISIGKYMFEPQQFQEVIRYIWRGGWPRWKDDEQPDYVIEMMKYVVSSKHWLFDAMAKKA